MAARKPHTEAAVTTHQPRRLTVKQFCEEMQISRSTFYAWLAKGKAPRCRKLPNGQLRIDRRDIDTWYESCDVAA